MKCVLLKCLIHGILIGVLSLYSLAFSIEKGGIAAALLYVLGSFSEDKLNKGCIWVSIALICTCIFDEWIIISYFTGGAICYLCGIIEYGRNFFSIKTAFLAFGTLIGGMASYYMCP